MQSDFKKDIIQLMQSTKLLHSRLSELSEEAKGIAYELLNRLADGAVDELHHAGLYADGTPLLQSWRIK